MRLVASFDFSLNNAPFIVITARNVHDRSDSTLEISDFIAKCRSSSPNTSPEGVRIFQRVVI